MTNAVVVKAVKTEAGQVELSAKAVKALNAFKKAKEAEAKAKALKAKAEAELRLALGEATVGFVAGVAAVRVVASVNTHFDREMMKDLYPEAFEATLRTTEYDYLKTL